MEYELSAEQEALREATQRFLNAECPLAVVRELADESPGYRPGLWRTAARLGWTSMLVPEEYGGGSVSGDGLRDLAIIAEECGRMVAPGPLHPVNIVASTIATAGTAEQRSALLPAIAAGETVVSWAFCEPPSRWRAQDVRLTATATDGGFVLRGEKSAVEAAAQSSHLLVTARTEGGLSQFIVPADLPGISVTELKSIDLVRRFGDVRFDDVEVGAATVVGRLGAAEADVEYQLQLALSLQCAEMVGAVDRVFSFTVQEAFNRYSFGRQLASYQALKHRFADMRLWLEACHATATAAIRATQARADNAKELTSVAKAYIGDHGPEIIQDCIQMHGGIGITWEHDLHLYLRRVTLDRALNGAPAEHRERIAALIGGSET